MSAVTDDERPLDLARRCLPAMLGTLRDHERELGDLDAVCGDGDHGSGMVRGMRAAVAVTGDFAGAGDYVAAAGMAFADAAGGSSGALVGSLLQSFGWSLGTGPCDPAAVAAALRSGVDAVMQLGGASRGERTMVDTWLPFAEAFEKASGDGKTVPEAWHAALPVAESSALATSAMKALRGRAAKVSGHGLGTPDAGAMSAYYLIAAIDSVLTSGDSAGERP